MTQLMVLICPTPNLPKFWAVVALLCKSELDSYCIFLHSYRHNPSSEVPQFRVVSCASVPAPLARRPPLVGIARARRRHHLPSVPRPHERALQHTKRKRLASNSFTRTNRTDHLPLLCWQACSRSLLALQRVGPASTSCLTASLASWRRPVRCCPPQKALRLVHGWFTLRAS